MARIEVRADVKGKVWKIEAKVGDHLDTEQDILILESMKMEIPVGAPKAGRLAEILVGEGDPVEENAIVAIIES